ncbi:MAG: NAD(P)/FAD-dependent oxidoreductase [Polyangiaceae bacterium]
MLAGAGAAAAALALPGRAHAKTCPKVAVVGGGIAGMTCAVKLFDRGIPCTVFEGQGRVGGRMFSNTSYFGGGSLVSEWCGELIDTGSLALKHLVQRFGLEFDDLLDGEPDGSEDTYYFFGQHYPRAQFEIDMEPVADAAIAHANAAGWPILWDDHAPAAAALDQMSVYDWVEANVPGGHDSQLGTLLDLAYTAEYANDSWAQSALNLVILAGYQSPSGDLETLGVSDGRFHIHGGNQSLPNAMANYLGVGSVVKLGHRLAKIRQTAAGRYKLTFEVGGATITDTFDYVVLALPFAVLRTLDYSQAGFDPLKETAVTQQGTGKSRKLQMEFTDRHWNGTGAWPGVGNGISYSDTGYQWTWDVSRAQPGQAGVLTTFTGGAAVDSATSPAGYAQASWSPHVAADAQAALAQLEPVYPGLSAKWTGRAMESLPHKSPFFKASYSTYLVGQYTSFAGYERVRQGGILFCGEHTSTDYQGFMEGAAQEGNRAAKELHKLIRGS